MGGHYDQILYPAVCIVQDFPLFYMCPEVALISATGTAWVSVVDMDLSQNRTMLIVAAIGGLSLFGYLWSRVRNPADEKSDII